MITVLMVKRDGGYRQEIYQNYNGNRQRIIVNRQKQILENIKNISLDFTHCVYVGNDVKYRTSDGNVLILKDYKKHLERKLYDMILSNVPENIPTTYKKKKVTIFSKTRILALTLATTAVVSLAGHMLSAKDEVTNDPIGIEDVFENYYFPNETVDAHEVILEPTEIQEEIDVFNIEDRLATAQNIINGEIENNKEISLATRLDEYAFNKISNYINSEKFESFKNNAETFGVDPYLLLAKAMTESSLEHQDTLPGGKFYNGSATGVCQIENIHIGEEITAYNYKTNQAETITVTREGLNDFDTNVKIASMIFQNQLYRYNNNIYLTIQAYNYGSYAMDTILNQYATATGKSLFDIMNDYEDLGWMPIVEDFHNNPQKYLPNWKYDKFGNDYYVNAVFSYYVGQISRNNDAFGNTIDIDLSTMQEVTNLSKTK